VSGKRYEAREASERMFHDKSFLPSKGGRITMRQAQKSNDPAADSENWKPENIGSLNVGCGPGWFTKILAIWDGSLAFDISMKQ